jgi:hypothetical protein
MWFALGRRTAMIDLAEAKKLVNELFEEEALVLGGLLAVHEVDDGLVWQLVRCLKAVRAKTLRRIEASETSHSKPALGRRGRSQPHPAIQQFLQTIQRRPSDE